MRVMRGAVLLLLLVSILNVSRGSFLAETDLGEKREAAVNRQQLDALVEYIVQKVQREQREQESPFYPGSMERLRLFPKGDQKRASPFNNNYADAVFRGLG